MTKTLATNYTVAGTTFFRATASTDPFAKEDLQYLQTAVDTHDHTAGLGLAVGRVVASLAMTTPVLTSPRVVTAMNDTNGNPLIVPTATASAVNGLGLINGATGTGPTLKPAGASSDANADLIVAGKGTGKVRVDASFGAITADADGATITFDMSVTDDHAVTLGGNRILAVSNVTTGQKFLLALKQDGTGTRTVTWFAGISWAGGVAPTLTTAINKTDLFGFRCTGAGAYQGFVVAQAI